MLDISLLWGPISVPQVVSRTNGLESSFSGKNILIWGIILGKTELEKRKDSKSLACLFFVCTKFFFFHLTYNSKLSKQNSFKEEWAGIQNCKCNKRFYLRVCHELPQIVLDFTINHSIYWNLIYTLHLHALTVNINLYSGCSFHHLLGQGSYGKRKYLGDTSQITYQINWRS